MIHTVTLPDSGETPWQAWLAATETQLLHWYEPEPGIFITESVNVTLRALHAGYEPLSLLLEEKQLPKCTELLEKCGDIPAFAAPEEILRDTKGYEMTRGVLCAMRRRETPAPEALCRDAKRIAVLENVVNPTNLGAIIRSAAALGVDAVLLSSGCTDPLYRRAARVSMGTVFQVPWGFLPDAPDAAAGVRFLRERGFHTAAMALRESSCAVDAPRLVNAEKLALVLGTEGEGLADATIAACDDTVMIPMAHGVDSLNVAAASAVAFFAVRRS